MKPTTEMMYAALQAAERERLTLSFQQVHTLLSAALDAEPGLVIEDTHTCPDGQCRLGKRLSVG